MKTLVSVTLILSALVFGGASTQAQRIGEITGTLSVSATTWANPVTYSVSTTPAVHTVSMGGKGQVDDLYITTVCSQGPTMVYQTSVRVAGTGVYQINLLSNNLVPVNLTQPGSCEAWLVHTLIKGKNHSIVPLDKITYSVTP
jgi:hypothetical protein